MTLYNNALDGLSSPDPMKFDQSYDTLLFEDNRNMNVDIIDSIREYNQEPQIVKYLMQILAFRATQVKGSKWYARLKGRITLRSLLETFFGGVKDVHADVRTEAIHCLGDLYEHNMKPEELTTYLNEYEKGIYPLCYPQTVKATLEILEDTANTDMDVNVQLLAADTKKRIEKSYKNFSKLTTFVDPNHYAEFEMLNR